MCGAAARAACTPAGTTLALELVAHSLSRASVVNTAATMGVLAPVLVPSVLFTDLVFRIAPYSASTPLGSSDALGVSSWTLRLENHLAPTVGPRTGTAPEEYERQQEPTISLTVVLPRRSADTWQTRWGANTTLMADATFSGGQIGSTGIPYQLNVYLPALQVLNAQAGTGGPGLPPDTVQLHAVIPSAAAAGFPTCHTNTPLAVEVVSGVSTHPLV